MRIPNLTFVYDRKGQATKIKSSVVELRITAEKTRKYISTGVKLLPKEWSNGSVVGRKDWKELNDQLQIMKRKCSEIISQMMDDGALDLNAIPSMLKDSLVRQQTFLEYAREIADTHCATLAEGTRKRYEVVFRFLGEWGRIVYFSDVTPRNIRAMDEELKGRGLKESSRYNYHKILKVFVLRAVEDGLIKQNPYTRLGIKRGDESGVVRHLTPVEFHRFETCEIPLEHLRRVRDLFVFQTYTMMGYSDLADFDVKKCVEVEGEKVYKGRRCKTHQAFTIPLLPQARAILEKYGGELPIISNAKYNLFLKAAIAYAGIDKMVTTHMARHTGATMLLNEAGIPLHIIQHILGHASIKETERTYAKLMDETIVEAMVKKMGR